MTIGNKLAVLRHRSVAFECAYQMARNAFVPVIRTTFGHARFTEYADPATSAKYAVEVFHRYRHALRACGDAKLDDASVLEVAPGQTMASTAAFLSAGATRVIGVDKYARVPLAPAYEHAIFLQLFTLLGAPTLAERAFESFTPTDLRFRPCIQFVDHCAAEDLDRLIAPASIDVVCSNLVFNHVRDLDAAYRAIHRILKPGGIMIHHIHFWHHFAFEWKGLFYYLSIPKAVWHMMTSRMYAVNRKSASDHRQLAKQAGFCDITTLVDEQNRHPRKEAELYLANHPSETRSVDDLTARYFTLCARRPG